MMRRIHAPRDILCSWTTRKTAWGYAGTCLVLLEQRSINVKRLVQTRQSSFTRYASKAHAPLSYYQLGTSFRVLLTVLNYS